MALKQHTLSVTEWFGSGATVGVGGSGQSAKPTLTIPFAPIALDAGWNNNSYDEAQLGDLWLISILHRALYVSEKYKMRYESVAKGEVPGIDGILMSVRAQPSDYAQATTEIINGISCKVYNFNFKVSIPDKTETPHPFVFDLDRLIQEVQ